MVTFKQLASILGFSVYVDGKLVTSLEKVSIKRGKWHHVVMVAPLASVEWYVRSKSSGGKLVDETRAWERVLSPKEVKKLYHWGVKQRRTGGNKK